MSNTSTVLVLMLLCVAVLCYAVPKAIGQHRRERAPGVIASFADLRLTETALIEGIGRAERWHDLAGLVARVEDSGTLNRRFTASRLVLMGPFALAAPKRQDDRSVYLTIEGPATAVLREVEMRYQQSAGSAARRFAMELNMRARR